MTALLAPAVCTSPRGIGRSDQYTPTEIRSAIE